MSRRGTPSFTSQLPRCKLASPLQRYRVLFTRYFVENVLPRRPCLREQWLELALRAPDWSEPQDDDRIRFWVYIPELRRFLRVVTLADGKTIHNAFPNRGFKRPDQ